MRRWPSGTRCVVFVELIALGGLMVAAQVGDLEQEEAEVASVPVFPAGEGFDVPRGGARPVLARNSPCQAAYLLR